VNTRRSPRNQEILWRALGGVRQTPPKKSRVSKIKPVFDWVSNRYVDPAEASYLDRLGTSSAVKYAPVIARQAGEANVSLPLPDEDVATLLTNTIEGLQKEKKLYWEKTPATRQQVFIDAWVAEMSRQGIRK
jgi:hypothetical protein